jgi:hypothetical protein
VDDDSLSTLQVTQAIERRTLLLAAKKLISYGHIEYDLGYFLICRHECYFKYLLIVDHVTNGFVSEHGKERHANRL